MMRMIPVVLERAYLACLESRGVSRCVQWAWRKWLRYYLDFCGKYEHPERDRESLQAFLQKLAEKGQDTGRQAEAAASIGLFYEVVAQFPAPGAAGATVREEAGLDWPAVFRRLKEVMRTRHNSPATLKTYRSWIRQFSGFVGSKPPAELVADDAARFLTWLATERRVVASTQNQAFNALLFLFRHILEKPYELEGKVVRARRRRHVPVVLTRDEVDRVVAHLSGPHRLLVLLLYGCGLRLSEGLNLRIHCFNFDDGILTIHRGKGGKDRTVPLPQCLQADLLAHREVVRKQFEADLTTERFAGSFMPEGSDRKWQGRARDWVWQFFFPAANLTLVPADQKLRRYHLHATEVGKLLRIAAREAQLDKRVTAHTFRHSFASHLLLANYDIRTIQEMMGHSHVQTTMIYTQTVPSRTRKDRRSPLDFAPDEDRRGGET
ncbi:MAG: integron integrase [Akkermansiaceae bacterium]|nr:integron integrase [Akkermansiaceae bacterium]